MSRRRTRPDDSYLDSQPALPPFLNCRKPPQGVIDVYIKESDCDECIDSGFALTAQCVIHDRAFCLAAAHWTGARPGETLSVSGSRSARGNESNAPQRRPGIQVKRGAGICCTASSLLTVVMGRDAM